MIVVTKTPLRISFFGGGSDLPEFYKADYGAVLTAAIDKYVYVTVKAHGELFGEPIRFSYSKTELVQRLDDIENEIGRESLRLLDISPPIFISTIADLPAGTGLGSSSAYAVGLLNALFTYKEVRATPGDLAEMAARVELDVLGKPIGKQDAYPAAFGGLHHIRFSADGSTSLAPINYSLPGVESIFRHLQLFWTGLVRDADSVLTEQKKNIPARRSILVQMRDLADEAAKLLRINAVSPRTFGEMLHASWELKRQLGSGITNSQIDTWYLRGLEAGAFGGKLCGAGGGGFILFCVPPDRREALAEALPQLREVPIHYEPMGSAVLCGGAPHHPPLSRSVTGSTMLHHADSPMVFSAGV